MAIEQGIGSDLEIDKPPINQWGQSHGENL